MKVNPKNCPECGTRCPVIGVSKCKDKYYATVSCISCERETSVFSSDEVREVMNMATREWNKGAKK